MDLPYTCMDLSSLAAALTGVKWGQLLTHTATASMIGGERGGLGRGQTVASDVCTDSVSPWNEESTKPRNTEMVRGKREGNVFNHRVLNREKRESAEPGLQMQWSPTCALARRPTLWMRTLRLGAKTMAQEGEGARTPSEPILPKWCPFNSL